MHKELQLHPPALLRSGAGFGRFCLQVIKYDILNSLQMEVSGNILTRSAGQKAGVGRRQGTSKRSP